MGHTRHTGALGIPMGDRMAETETATPHQPAEVGELFTMVEMEVNRLCNRRCSYCPNSVLGERDTDLPELMPAEVLDRLIDELDCLDFTGRISFHLYNEPLLHPDLPGIVGTLRTRLPEVRQVLYSNGDYLTDAVFERLHSAGVNRFVITSHDGREIPERPDQVVLQTTDLGLTNRAGTLDSVPEALAIPCLAPASMLIVGVNGDVLLCYEDATRSQVMGNILSEPIDEIWYSPRFCELRAALAAGDRRVTPMCRACDNTNHRSADEFDYVP